MGIIGSTTIVDVDDALTALIPIQLANLVTCVDDEHRRSWSLRRQRCPVHSFRTLLLDLATVAKSTVVTSTGDDAQTSG